MSKMTGVGATSVAVQAPPPLMLTEPLRRIKQIGYIVLGIELAGFLVWSTVLYNRFSLTSDFSIYHQAWFEIAHGNLDPYSTLQQFPYRQSHSEFIMWPVALLYWAWPHGVTLLWLQDISVVATEAVAFTWMWEIAQRHRPGRDAVWLAGGGLLLLVANPWLWWAVSFDFHAEMLAVLFAVLLARDLAAGRRRAWIWVGTLLLCGDVAGTYLAGIGLGAVLTGRRWWRRGTVMACLGVGATLLISVVHGNLGADLANYEYLATTRPITRTVSALALIKGIAGHPVRVLQAVWSKRLDMWANLASGGFLGIGALRVLPLVLIVLLENTLYSQLMFAAPLFQATPIYVLIPIGTVAVLSVLARHHRRIALALTCLAVAQTLGWMAVWGPRTASQWLRVPRPTAATLSSVLAQIRSSDEVFASQGVVGRFAGRADVQALVGPGRLPVRGECWFVIAPDAGIEKQSTASAMALISELASLHATLVTHADGVWAFRWQPPRRVHTITVPAESASLPAWAATSAAGRPLLTGPSGTWHVTSTGAKGYVADGIAWQEPPGRYLATVTLSAAGPVKVEVWNDTGNVLLERRALPWTTGTESIVLPVDARAGYHASVHRGWGPFSADFVLPPPGERLEVRVWSPGGARVNVYGATLTAASAPPSRTYRRNAGPGS